MSPIEMAEQTLEKEGYCMRDILSIFLNCFSKTNVKHATLDSCGISEVFALVAWENIAI
jgi:hypothetical protein